MTADRVRLGGWHLLPAGPISVAAAAMANAMPSVRAGEVSAADTMPGVCAQLLREATRPLVILYLHGRMHLFLSQNA